MPGKAALQAQTGIDASFAQHAVSMGGYTAETGYSDKREFFERYYHNAGSRKINYNHFIRKHLERGDRTLFVASGQCANELELIEDGFSNITASELDYALCHDALLRLFPGFRMLKYDVLSGPAPEKYDAIISLSLCYLFGPKEMDRFFSNVASSLKSEGGGKFILDVPASPPHIFCRMYHHGLLRGIAELRRLFHLLRKGRMMVLEQKQHGYFHDTDEIVAYGLKYGFTVKDYSEYDFRTEFERIGMLAHFMEMSRFAGNAAEMTGRLLNMPYTRMFFFEHF